MPKIVLLVGAPSASTFTQQSLTTTSFHHEFTSLLNVESGKDANKENGNDNIPHALWRSLPLNPQPLHTGLSPIHHDIYALSQTNEFLTTANLSFASESETPGSQGETQEELLTQFCEQSLAIHNSISSSQREDEAASVNDSVSTFTTPHTSFYGTIPPPIPNAPANLSDLEDIPTAQDILGYHPQTITVNLIVGVLSIAQPRSVKTRWGNELSLIEVFLGDETKSAFSVTFWVPTGSASQSQVAQLRRQDVILLQNVGLHVFRKRVYGQTLRRDMTKIDLLWRRDGGSYYTTKNLKAATSVRGQDDPQIQKTKDVVDWMLRFVGPDPAVVKRPSQSVWHMPPPDTQ